MSMPSEDNNPATIFDTSPRKWPRLNTSPEVKARRLYNRPSTLFSKRARDDRRRTSEFLRSLESSSTDRKFSESSDMLASWELATDTSDATPLKMSARFCRLRLSLAKSCASDTDRPGAETVPDRLNNESKWIVLSSFADLFSVPLLLPPPSTISSVLCNCSLRWWKSSPLISWLLSPFLGGLIPTGDDGRLLLGPAFLRRGTNDAVPDTIK
mmetsp:Transcript_6213/g.18361  ORF Transcript_6213/g.18361 Transcript_6213/m.18361 type:complete len:212 (+) Transcript_6213:447-1082(+)